MMADILTADKERTIGSKIIDFSFFEAVKKEIKRFDWDSCRQKGQAYIELPPEACRLVSAGVGKRSPNPDDYVIRVHRGRVGLFLKRELAADADKVAVIVYTAEAYRSDPDVSAEEIKRARRYTHILVAVLASAGPKSPLTPYRFVHNLAGGNKEAQLWTADEIRFKAKEIKDYTEEWCIIAD